MPLFDSNILIDYLRDRPDAVSLIHTRKNHKQGLTSSVICRAEVLNGMRPGEEKETRAFLNHFAWFDVTKEITEASSKYFREYNPSHGIDMFDSLIAGTALVHNLELYTANQKHYPMNDILISQPYS